jgi:hypothetical protein
MHFKLLSVDLSFSEVNNGSIERVNMLKNYTQKKRIHACENS